MNILSILFPVNLYLNIYQLENYDSSRFIKWISKNLFVRSLGRKRGLNQTLKTKLLLLLSFTFLTLFLIILNILGKNIFFAITFTFIFATQFYFPLILSRLVLYPFEILIINRNIRKTNKKIKSMNGLRVIAITGSYGKTSVKEILYQLIKDTYKTLRTPESFNTILGISKVVDYELDNSYKYFICEMAAYHKDDIYNLCKMVAPDYGILTGITTQHLERFGTLENIIRTKFELYDYIQNKNNIIFNLNDRSVNGEIKKINVLNPQGYVEATKLRFSKKGSSFEIIYNKKNYQIETSLFGISNVENLTGALTMALKLGIKIEYLIGKSRNILPVANRSFLRQMNKATIVDNTYSSNEESFTEMIKTAKSLKGKKALITPGLVELGDKEQTINSAIGKLSNNIFDKIVLVGNNNRTRAFENNLMNKPDFISDNRKDYFEKINELSKNYDWLFLENDITENY